MNNAQGVYADMGVYADTGEQEGWAEIDRVNIGVWDSVCVWEGGAGGQ